MTLMQNPLEHNRQRAGLQGFEAYREVAATKDIRFVQNELAHVFGDAITLLDYNDAQFGEKLSRVTIVSRELGTRMVRSACSAGVESDVIGKTAKRVAGYVEGQNKIVDTYASKFTVTGHPQFETQKISLTVPTNKGAATLDANRIGIATSVAGNTQSAMPVNGFELSLPLAVTDNKDVVAAIEGLCVTRYIHVPLGPLFIER